MTIVVNETDKEAAVRLHHPMKSRRRTDHAQPESANVNDDHQAHACQQPSTASTVLRSSLSFFDHNKQNANITCGSTQNRDEAFTSRIGEKSRKKIMKRRCHQEVSDSSDLLGNNSREDFRQPTFHAKDRQKKQTKKSDEHLLNGPTNKQRGKASSRKTSAHHNVVTYLLVALFLFDVCFQTTAHPLLGLSSWPSSTSWSSKTTENATTPPPSGIYWSNLSVQTADGTFLLNKCHGFVKNGHVCGVLGPSGAGKSTTLSAIAGGGATSSSSSSGGKTRSGLQINGHVLCYDAEKQTKEQLRIGGGKVAWLKQKDTFFHMLTVQETLQFAAFLELPHLPKKQRQQTVISLMESLGLAKLATRKVEGLSGGEKRRLSLALELLSSPSLFIGDEPTSGLDSTMSAKVVRLIQKSVQERGIPAMLSLHQPRSSIFKMLDSCLILAPGGHVVYMGKAKNAVEYFTKLGYGCPAETNPAEFLLDLVSIDSEDPIVAREDEMRISHLAVAFIEHQQSAQEEVDVDSVLENAVSVDDADANTNKSLSTVLTSKRKHSSIFRPIQRFGRLLLRSWRQNIRNHRVNMYRLVASGGTAYLFTNIFQSIKKGVFTPKSVADRVALLSFSVINMSLMALMKTVELFAKEKPVVQREQQRHQYTSLEYLLAKAIAEIPLDTVFAAVFTTTLKHLCGLRIGWRALTGAFTLMTVAGASLGFAIGAVSPTGDVALTVSVPILVVLMTVGIINPSGASQSDPPPPVVTALKQVSPVGFAIRAVCLAEYRGMEFQSQSAKKGFWARGTNLMKDLPKMGALALVQNGDQVLDELGLGEHDYKGAMKHLAMLSCANLLLSWIGLRFQAQSHGSGPRKQPP